MHHQRLIGEKCYLSPVSAEDAEKFTKWLNDAEVLQTVAIADRIWSLEKERAYLANAVDAAEPMFAIVDRQSDKLIGSCGLFDIHPIDRTCECGILIGDRSFWGRGYGEEALRLLLDYGFGILNMSNIMLKVYDYNQRAVHCYEKIGFHPIGVRRNAHVYCGKSYGVLYMEILADEFVSPYLAKVFEESAKSPSDRLKILAVE
jgi:RimJ/RimL family protein N-acetyltransferase